MARCDVILPVFNAESTIRQAVFSILEQTERDIQLLVLDDGSTDSSLRLLEDIDDPRMQVISNRQNSGIASVLNQGIALTTSPFIARMDADDIAHPSRIERQLSVLESEAGLDLVGCNLVCIDNSNKLLGQRNFPLTHEQIIARPYRSIPMAHPAWCGRRAWFLNNPYDESELKAQDQSVLLRARNRSRYKNLPEPLLAYRESTSLHPRSTLFSRAGHARRIISTAREEGHLIKGFFGASGGIVRWFFDILVWITRNPRIAAHRFQDITNRNRDEWIPILFELGASRPPEFQIGTDSSAGGQPQKKRILHIINDLNVGGAETMLLRLMQTVDRSRFDPVIITMIESGELGPQFEALGIEMHALGARPGRISPRILFKMRSLIRSIRPDLIQSWLYHSNLAAFLASSLYGPRVPLAWSIRHSLYDLGYEPWLTRQVIRVGARCSSRVSGIIFNSQTSLEQHHQFGFNARKHMVIPNGFDLSEFSPNSGARDELVSRLGLNPNSFLVGHAGRYHHIKDHALLAKSCARLVERGIDVQLLCAGRGCEAGGALEALKESTGLGPRLHLLGEQRPLAPFLSGLDCLALSSKSEAFPNVLAETMATGVACISTDVGDARLILGDSARIVPPNDPEQFTTALAGLHSLGTEGRHRLGTAGRERIQEHFELQAVSDRYQDFWTDLLSTEDSTGRCSEN